MTNEERIERLEQLVADLVAWREADAQDAREAMKVFRSIPGMGDAVSETLDRAGL